jgi:hypothetical protein
MQTATHLRNLALYTCIAFAMLSGAYFGLLGCGSYSWHWKLRQTLELVLSTAWATFTIYIYTGLSKNERSVFRTIGLCVGIYFGMHALFITSMALVAPFYPAPPSSLNDWWQGFSLSWLEGTPC